MVPSSKPGYFNISYTAVTVAVLSYIIVYQLETEDKI